MERREPELVPPSKISTGSGSPHPSPPPGETPEEGRGGKKRGEGRPHTSTQDVGAGRILPQTVKAAEGSGHVTARTEPLHPHGVTPLTPYDAQLLSAQSRGLPRPPAEPPQQPAQAHFRGLAKPPDLQEKPSDVPQFRDPLGVLQGPQKPPG